MIDFKKLDLQKILLLITTVLSLLFGYYKYTETTALSETVNQLSQERIQREAFTDSIQQQLNGKVEQVEVLQLSNKELSSLNDKLTTLSKQKQKVKYVTTSEITQSIRDTLNFLSIQAFEYKKQADSLRQVLDKELLYDQPARELRLWEALENAYSLIPQWPLQFLEVTPWYTAVVTVTPSEITQDSTHYAMDLQMITQDTLQFSHSTSRKWFLGRKTHHVFVETQSPNSATKTYSYSFSK